MKKVTKLLLLAAGIVSLAACQKDLRPMFDFDTRGEINFKVKGITLTKAFAEVENDTLQKNGFGVAAVVDSDNGVMFNSPVAYANDVYKVPGESYYFPASGTMSFYGVYPSSQAISIANDGTATLEYSQNADIDLLVAMNTPVARQENPVLMQFNHALTQVNIECQGEDATVDYFVKDIKIFAAPSATYSYADDAWSNLADSIAYNYFTDASGKQISTANMSKLGAAMSFVPAEDSKIEVIWECRVKGQNVVTAEYDKFVVADFVQGEHPTYKLTLPNTLSSEIPFATTVGDWVEENVDRTVKAAATIFVEAEAGETVTLPSINLAKGAKGYVDWGDGNVDIFKNAEPVTKSATSENIEFVPTHKYEESFSGEVEIYMLEGKIETIANPEDSVVYTIKDENFVDKNFVFTVNDEGKKVVFAPGNLYWDGTKFNFEENQWTAQKEYDPEHLDQFYWSSDPAIAVAETYDDPNASIEDELFCSNGKAIKGYTTLSEEEWLYLEMNSLVIDYHDNAWGGDVCFMIQIDSIWFMILTPDNGISHKTRNSMELSSSEFKAIFNGATSDDKKQIVTDLGLVLLPVTNYRSGTEYKKEYGDLSSIWTGSPQIDTENCGGDDYPHLAKRLQVFWDDNWIWGDNRGTGGIIKLVKE